ncbi:MAG: sensor histidine kinase, partial [Parvibaculaceae bacterium]
ASRIFVDFERLRREVVRAGRLGQASPIDAKNWFRESTAAIDSLLAVEEAAGRAATRHRDNAFLRAAGAIALGAALFVIVTGAAAFSLFLFKRRVSGPLRQITQATRRFARGDYDVAIPDVLTDLEVAGVAAAIEEFRTDAVEQARLKRELQTARETAEAASRAKSQFLANMSHELRTPLNAIIGFSELIKTQALGPLGHDKYREYASDVHDSGRRLLDIINDVLDMARIETQQSTLEQDDVDLAEIVALGIRRIEERARLAGLSVEMECSGSVRMKADPAKIDRVVANLLSNAVKFTPAGGRITVRIFREAGGGAVVEVCDTGIGMSSSDIAKVFEPFYQVDADLNRRHEGTGLGIPLSNAIARMHGGQLQIDSEPGAGTRVRMILPRARRLG